MRNLTVLFYLVASVCWAEEVNFKKKVTLEWESIEKSKYYEIRIRALRESKNVQDWNDQDSVYKAEKNSFSLNLLPGAYQYQVRSVDRLDRKGDWSPNAELVILPSPAVISKPADDSRRLAKSFPVNLELKWKHASRTSPRAKNWDGPLAIPSNLGTTAYTLEVYFMGSKIEQLQVQGLEQTVLLKNPGSYEFVLRTWTRGSTKTYEVGEDSWQLNIEDEGYQPWNLVRGAKSSAVATVGLGLGTYKLKSPIVSYENSWSLATYHLDTKVQHWFLPHLAVYGGAELRMRKSSVANWNEYDLDAGIKTGFVVGEKSMTSPLGFLFSLGVESREGAELIPVYTSSLNLSSHQVQRYRLLGLGGDFEMIQATKEGFRGRLGLGYFWPFQFSGAAGAELQNPSIFSNFKASAGVDYSLKSFSAIYAGVSFEKREQIFSAPAPSLAVLPVGSGYQEIGVSHWSLSVGYRRGF